MSPNVHFSVAKLRTALSVLDDPQLEAFCKDNYPKVQQRFSRGLYKDEKITLLLDYCDRYGKLPELDALLNDYFASQEAPLLQTKLTMSERPSNSTNQSTNFVRIKLQLDLADSMRSLVIRGLDVPGGGTPHNIVDLPFTANELKSILKILDVGSDKITGIKPEIKIALESKGLLLNNRLHPNFYSLIGQILYRSIFSGEIYDEIRRAKDSQKNILCNILIDPEDVLLAQYPWELIHDGNTFMVPIKGGIQLTRQISYAAPPPVLGLKLPLKILIIRPRPTDDSVLPKDEEMMSLLLGISPLQEKGLITWHELSPATWSEFETILNRETFSLIHFDGHGSYARLCPKCREAHYPNVEKCTKCKSEISNVTPMGYLHFQDSNGEPDWVSIVDFKTVLINSRAQLIILTSCGSAVVNGTSVFNGIAPGLIQSGIPAVVGMQGSPTVGTTIKFVARLYSELSKGETLPSAVNKGRLAIFRDKPISWFMPVIYLRSTDSQNGKLFTL